MNMNSTFLLNSLYMIPEVLNVDMSAKSTKISYKIKCDATKRNNVINKIISMLNDVFNIDAKHTQNNYKSSIGIVESDDYEFLVKPVSCDDYLNNELRLVDLFHEYEPKNIIFFDGKKNFIISNVVDVLNRDVLNKRDKTTRLVNKEDICIKSKKCNIPISIKKTGGNTFWESADGILNDDSEKIVKYLINKFNIKDFDGRKLKHDILIENHNINLFGCVYGNDILPKGCVAVTNFHDTSYVNGSLYIKCDRVFDDRKVMFDDVYSPVAILSKCKNRNKGNPYLKNLVSKVCTKSRAKTAVSLKDIKKLEDIYDESRTFD